MSGSNRWEAWSERRPAGWLYQGLIGRGASACRLQLPGEGNVGEGELRYSFTVSDGSEEAKMGLRSVWILLIGLGGAGTAVAAEAAGTENWVEIGADPQGKYYVDTRSLAVEGETLRFRKKGVYNFSMLETFGDKKISFRASVGVIEIDCARRIHRMVQMDVVSPEGEVVWTTGKLNRMWEDIMPDTLGDETHKFVCKGMTQS